jgi:hypothetical protein
LTYLLIISIAVGNGFPVALGLLVALGNALGLLVAIDDDLSAMSTSLLFCVVPRWKRPVFLLLLLIFFYVELTRNNLQVRKQTPATTAAATAATVLQQY